MHVCNLRLPSWSVSRACLLLLLLLLLPHKQTSASACFAFNDDFWQPINKQKQQQQQSIYISHPPCFTHQMKFVKRLKWVITLFLNSTQTFIKQEPKIVNWQPLSPDMLTELFYCCRLYWHLLNSLEDFVSLFALSNIRKKRGLKLNTWHICHLILLRPWNCVVINSQFAF